MNDENVGLRCEEAEIAELGIAFSSPTHIPDEAEIEQLVEQIKNNGISVSHRPNAFVVKEKDKIYVIDKLALVCALETLGHETIEVSVVDVLSPSEFEKKTLT